MRAGHEVVQLASKLVVPQAEKEKAANEKALKEATAVREKESSEFNTDEKDMLQFASFRRPWRRKFS